MMPADVILQTARGRLVLADAGGKALYSHAPDAKAGRPTCLGDCAAAWPFLKAPADARPFGDWTVVTREDGGRQWALRGRPLYTSAKDEAPGDLKGDGADGAWHAVFHNPEEGLRLPDGFAVQELPDAGGLALVDARGMTLYVSDMLGAEGVNGSDRPCVTGEPCWLPAVAPALANPMGDFTLLARPDGQRQWAYKGQALYGFGGDTVPGDVQGAGIDARRRAALVARYFRPAEVIVRRDEARNLMLTTPDGMTVYARERLSSRNGHHLRRKVFSNVPQTRGPLGCEGDCTRDWRPLLAPADARSADYWRVVVRADGSRQWAYQGFPLYTYAGDHQPGEVTGNDVIQYDTPAEASFWRFVVP
jgi:predicted lipoprotein with Yx(FWY)xxD motif